jgi:hypothetical protein
LRSRERQGRKENETGDTLRMVSRDEFNDLCTHAVSDEDDISVHLIDQTGDHVCMAVERKGSFCVP